MQYTAREAISALDYSELCNLRDDLKQGGKRIRGWVEQQLRAFEQQHQQQCAVCGAAIEAESTSTTTLVFGPESFKKKATFCARDCLTYFLQHQQDLKKKADADGKSKQEAPLASAPENQLSDP